MIDFTNFKSLTSVIKHFNNEDICKQTLVEVRWGDDVVCPHCGQHHCTKRKDGRYRCNHCKHNFSCLTDTIFENTKLSLQKWFIAMYLISSHKNGLLGVLVILTKNKIWDSCKYFLSIAQTCMSSFWNNSITDSGAFPERNWAKNLFLDSVLEGTIIISSIMKPFLLMVPTKCPFTALIFIASSYFIKIDINHYILHESYCFLW